MKTITLSFFSLMLSLSLIAQTNRPATTLPLETNLASGVSFIILDYGTMARMDWTNIQQIILEQIAVGTNMTLANSNLLNALANSHTLALSNHFAVNVFPFALTNADDRIWTNHNGITGAFNYDTGVPLVDPSGNVFFLNGQKLADVVSGNINYSDGGTLAEAGGVLHWNSGGVASDGTATWLSGQVAFLAGGIGSFWNGAITIGDNTGTAGWIHSDGTASLRSGEIKIGLTGGAKAGISDNGHYYQIDDTDSSIYYLHLNLGVPTWTSSD